MRRILSALNLLPQKYADVRRIRIVGAVAAFQIVCAVVSLRWLCVCVATHTRIRQPFFRNVESSNLKIFSPGVYFFRDRKFLVSRKKTRLHSREIDYLNLNFQRLVAVSLNFCRRQGNFLDMGNFLVSLKKITTSLKGKRFFKLKACFLLNAYLATQPQRQRNAATAPTIWNAATAPTIRIRLPSSNFYGSKFNAERSSHRYSLYF